MYSPKYSQTFEEVISSPKKKDIDFVEAIKEGVSKLLLNPYNNDSWLKYEYAGKHKKYIGGRSRYRVIFAICEECLRRGDERFNNCEWCPKEPKKVIVFFDAIRRSEGYN